MADLPITGFDILVGAVLLISALLAYARGFVHEVLAIAAWVGAFFLSVHGFPIVQPYAHKIAEMGLITDVALAAVLFIASLVVLSMLTRSLTRRIRDSALNALDRALGFVFGVLRGAIIVCLAYVGVAMIWHPEDQPAWMRGARTMPLVESGADWLKSLVPGDAKAAGTAGKAETKKLDSGPSFDDMKAPKPKAATSANAQGGSDVGYDAKERSNMDRLYETNK